MAIDQYSESESSESELVAALKISACDVTEASVAIQSRASHT
jgi:hypothetical protein